MPKSVMYLHSIIKNNMKNSVMISKVTGNIIFTKILFNGGSLYNLTNQNTEEYRPINFFGGNPKKSKLKKLATFRLSLIAHFIKH